MPNKNYVKGRRKEYKICAALKEAGYDIAQRSAGSHSPIDVFAIRKRDKKILLVQSKPDDMAASEIMKLYKKYGSLSGTNWTVRFEVY